MESIDTARQLTIAGRYTCALQTLDRISIARSERVGGDVLRAQLLERIGRHSQSRALVESLLGSKELTQKDKGVCEHVLARIEAENGNTDLSIQHLQKSISFANQGGALEGAFW